MCLSSHKHVLIAVLVLHSIYAVCVYTVTNMYMHAEGLTLKSKLASELLLPYCTNTFVRTEVV